MYCIQFEIKLNKRGGAFLFKKKKFFQRNHKGEKIKLNNVQKMNCKCDSDGNVY